MAGGGGGGGGDGSGAGHGGFFFSFVLICLASLSIGVTLKRKFDFPLLTGFLITGIITGPYILEMMTESEVDELVFVFDLCLGFIALAAGGEMYLPHIRPLLGSIIKVTLMQNLVLLVVGVPIIYAFAPYTSFMDGMSDPQKISVALITAVIFTARSPSSAIAIINELGAKGPFVQTSLGVTMVSDVVVIVGFAITSDIAVTLFDSSQSLSGEFVSVLLGDIFLSLIVGSLLSLVLGRILRFNGDRPERFCKRRLPRFYKQFWVVYMRGHSDLLRGGLLVLAGYVIFATAKPLSTHGDIHLETLLTCMTGAFITVNRDHYYPADGGRRINYRHRLHAALNSVSDPIYVAFFTVVGLGLNVSILKDVIGIALFFFFLRFFLLFAGSYLGGWWSGDPRQHRRLSAFTYLTQAGVALALTEAVKEDFPSFGEDYATTIVAVLVIGQIIGPLTFKWAVNKVGEATSKKDGENDQHTRDAVNLTVWWWGADGENGADGANNNNNGTSETSRLAGPDDDSAAKSVADIGPAANGHNANPLSPIREDDE